MWLDLLNLSNSINVSNGRVCDSHFDSSSFITNRSNKTNSIVKKPSKRLKRGALPTNLTVPAQTTCSSRSVSTQTDLDLNDLSNLFEKLSLYDQKLFKTTICIERFRDDDINIKYYTGFRSYNIFTLVFELLEIT